MENEDDFADKIIEAAVIAGAKRCVNDRRMGSSVLLPPDRDEGWDARLMVRHHHNFPAQELRMYNIELLRNVDDLLQFIDANVGDSEEFPIEIIGENLAAVDALQEQVDKLRHTSGMLLEI